MSLQNLRVLKRGELMADLVEVQGKLTRQLVIREGRTELIYRPDLWLFSITVSPYILKKNSKSPQG